MSLEIEKQTAKRLYPTSPDWFKSQLEESFGKEFFDEKEFEKIKTFADACKSCGTTEKEFNERFSKLGLSDDTLCYEKLKIVAQSINNGWIPDWNNSTQKKWWPWFNLSSGFGFSASNYDYTFADSLVGSRLCFESSEKSDYAANQFLELYEGFLTIKK